MTSLQNIILVDLMLPSCRGLRFEPIWRRFRHLSLSSLFFFFFAVENVAHCEFAFLRDLLIRWEFVLHLFYSMVYDE